MKIIQIGIQHGRYDKNLYENTKDNDQGISISRISMGRSSVLGGALPLTFRTLLRRFGEYDIVHNLSGYPFFPLKTGPVFASTAHEMQVVLYPELTPLLTKSFKDLLWNKLIVDIGLHTQLACDYIFANSQLTGEGLVKAGFPRSRIFVTPLGVDRRFMTPVKKHKEGRIFTVGSLGGLSVQKNAALAIAGFRKVEDRNIRMEVWGRNYYGDALNGMVGDSPQIKVMGPAPEDKLVSIYDSFDAFMFTTRFDGFGLPILEAKARGLPVIVWKHGHLSPEVKRYCIEAEDEEHIAQIIEELKQNGYNEKQRKKAMDDARSFTWERMADQTLRAYKKMYSA